MSEYPNKASGEGGRDVYEIGYGKPPKASQFKPGVSGNPAGRRKGVRNLATDVRRTLSTPVRVKEAGRARKRSTQEGVLLVLREKALQGDLRALPRLIELAIRFNNDVSDLGPIQALPEDDQAILTAYVAERLAAAIDESPAPSEAVASIDPEKKVAK